MKRKSLIIILLSAAIILLSAIIALCGYFYLHSARYGQAVLALEEEGKNYSTLLGDSVLLQLSGTLPWGQELAQSSFAAGEGVTPAGNIKIDKSSASLRGRKLRLTVPLKSYRTGKLKSGKLHIIIDRPFFRNGSSKLALEFDLPELEVAARKVTDRNQLPLADQLTAPAERSSLHWFPFAAGAVIAVIIGVLLYCRRRQAPAIELPPWEIARRNLNELRRTADSGKQPLSWCVAQLTDVVRNYLSMRFQWPVRQQTTGEFFASLRHKKTPLTARQLRYLEDFLNSADLVKFANIRPDQRDFDLAVDRAEELVAETSLPQTADPSASELTANNRSREEI